MFDGAGIATLSTVAIDSLVQNQAEALSSPEDVTVGDAPPDPAPTGEPQFSSSDQALFDALAAYDTSAARQEIVFLSPSVRDYQQLLDGISPNVEVFVLDPTHDGVAQMAEVLAGRSGVDAIHLIGEGTEAEMHLGASFLTQDSISGHYAEQFRQIGQSLSVDADLLIYGCNFGRGGAGETAIQTLAALTGADVAASTDLTGSAALGGDWNFEVQTGAIESAVAVTAEGQAAYGEVLDITTGLLGHWTFNSNANDSSGNNYDGTLTNGAVIDTTIATNIVGSGKLTLDGTDDHVTLSSYAGNFSTLTQGTIAGWVRATGNFETLFSISDTADTGSYTALFLGASGYLTYEVAENGVLQLAVYKSSAAINDGNWHHVAVTVGPSGNSLYVDGVLTTSGQLTYDAGNATTQRFFNNVTSLDSMAIGRNQDSGGGKWYTTGNVDDVRVYNRVLTSGDVGQLYATSNDPPINTVPGAQSTNEDTNLVFSSGNGNQIAITDPDSSGTAFEVTLSITNGSLTLAGTTGLTFTAGDGTADSTMTFHGTVTNINSALNGLTYSPTADYNGGATLTLATKDSALVSLQIDANLQARYTFEGNADDVAGTPQNGTLVGNPTYANDATRGQVLSLDGVGDYVQISGTFSNPTEVTIGGWVNLASGTGRKEFISLSDRVHLALDDASGVKGSVQIGASSWIDLNSNQFIAGTGWHHVMYSYSDVGNVHRLYIDGAEVASATAASSIYWTGASDTYIGHHPASGFEPNALVDDARIYNRVLTEAGVAALAADLSLIDTDTVAITVDAQNDPPVVTSGGSFSAQENTTAVTTVTSTDVDGGAPAYSIVPVGSGGAADAALFTIDSGTGVLSFTAAPDYEAPTDSGGNNVYDVTVQVSDGNGGTDTQTLAVTVTNQAITSVSATGSATALGGGVYTLNLGANENATSWTINWGDGTIETVPGNPGSVTHTYAAGNAGLTFNILASATDAAGTHFVNDVIAPTAFLTGEGLYRYDADAGTFVQYFSGAELTNPYAVTVGPDGLIYAAGHTSDNIVRYNAATGAFVDTFVAAGSGGLNAAAGLTFGPDGHLYVSNQIGDSILKYNGTTGAFISTFVSAGSGGLNAPVALIFRSDGYLYVGSYNSDSILRYNATTGAFVGTFVAAGSGGLNGPAAMAWGPDGNLYVASNDATVKRYNGTTGAFLGNFVTTGSGGLGEAVGLSFGPDGNLYVSSYSTDKIIKYNGTTGALIGDYVTAGSGGLDGPTSFTFLPNQQVLISSNQLVVDTAADNNDSGIVDGNSTHTISWLLVNKGADGFVSLREAIIAANNTVGMDGISFSIAGAGPHTINVLSALPTISQGAIIDGTSEPDFAGTPMIELNGTSAGGGVSGLFLDATAVNSVIRGLVINRFGGSGLVVAADNVTIAGNYIGIDVTGSIDLGNGADGILLTSNATGAVVGGAAPEDRNVVSGNTARGIAVSGSGTGGGHLIRGNHVGTNFAGAADLGNTGHGIDLNNSAGNTIRENVVSGNDVTGVIIYGEASDGNLVVGNRIGTDLTGTVAIGNGTDGIVIGAGADNNLIGGSLSTDRNIISGNTNDGIEIDDTGTSGNTISGNYIGTDLTGTAALGNGRFGVVLYNGVNSTTIGGSVFGAGNLISGNVSRGIQIDANANSATTDNVIQGNIIGLDKDGAAALGNGDDGILLFNGAINTTIGGTTALTRNVISGNNGNGIRVNGSSTTANVIQGNYIGTDSGGTLNRQNAGAGIVMTNGAGGNTIGGLPVGAGNTIAFNQGDGVRLTGSAGDGNSILGNCLFANAGDGIDLSNNGITPNDGQSTPGEPNELIDTPVVTTANLSGATLTLDGFVGMAPGDTDFANVRVEFFISTNEATHGAGRTYLGFLTTDANGNFSGSLTVAGLTVADLITATATDVSGNTSEFGPNVDVNVAPVVDLNGVIAGQDVTTAFTEQTPVLVAPAGTITDADLTNLTSLTVTLTTRPDGNAVESLALNAAATTAASGAGLTVSYTAGTGVLSITGPASTAVYETILQGILYNNTSDAPTMTDRSITVVAHDGALPSATQTATITMTAQNDPPVITSNGGGNTASISVAETITAVTDVNATDPEAPPQTLSYSISGVDAGDFTIDSNTGVLTFASAPDFENPTDADTNNIYLVTVQVSDGNGGTDTQDLTITVTDVASTLVVTTTSDADDTGLGASYTIEQLNALGGAVSLREAITAANTTAGTDTISFNIAGAGVHTINPLSFLPIITDAVSIDGYTQSGASVNTLATGNNAVLLIELDGTGTPNSHGLELGIGSDGSTIRGLVINRFVDSGIRIFSDNNTIEGNFIGTNAAGTTDLGNTVDGIRITGGSNTIGGATAAARNIISGNNDDGIDINGAGASNNQILGNYIGTDVTGTLDRGNSNNGVTITGGATGNLIGTNLDGTDDLFEGNLISGNDNNGVQMWSSGTSGNAVRGNLIGVDSTASVALANGTQGVQIGGGATGNTIGGTSAAAANVLAGNTFSGIDILGAGTTGNIVQGNFIGTNSGGGLNLANGTFGVIVFSGATGNTIGGTALGAGNTVAFNLNDGIRVDGALSTGNAILGNSIHDNTGQGIALGGDGITPNDLGDGDTGENNLMNFPVIYSVTITGGNVTISGEGRPGVTVEFFESPNAAGANGQAQTFIGRNTIGLTGTAGTIDPTAVQFSFTFAVGSLVSGDRVTATATNVVDGTSEFSANVAANAAPVVDLNGAGAGNDVTSAFTEQTPVLIAPVGTLTDADSANLSSLTVTLTARPDGDGVESLSLNGAATTAASGAGLTVTYTAGTGVLSITGSATTAVYQTILQGIFFNDTSETPTTTDRTITVVANDGVVNSATQTVTLTVTAQNDPPNLLDATVAVDENSANGTAVTNVNDSFTGTDLDRDGEAITYSITAGNTGGAFAIDSATGAITVATSAALDFETTPSFTLTVQASDGTLTDTAAITVNLNNLNDNAPAIGDATVAVDENSANGTAVTNVNDSFTGTDLDRDNDAITYSITAGNTGGAFAIDAATGAITVANSGALDFETTPSFTLTVQASDGTLSDTAAITINLNNLNEPPVAGDDVAVTTENTAVTTGNVLANDNDVDSVLSPASITAFDAVSVNGGTVVNNGDGTFTYTPGVSFTGIDTFTYTVSDGLSSDTATVTITVTPAGNSAPSLTANTGSTAIQGLTDVITASELQVIDLDNSPSQLVYTVTTAPANGQLELTTAPGVAITTFTQADIDAGRVVFVHSGAAATSDSFTFTVSDGVGGMIGATTFTFTVSPFIPPPGGGGNGGSGGGGGTGSSGGTGSGSGSGPGGSGGVAPLPIQPPAVLIGVVVPVKEMSVVGVTNDPLPRAMSPNRTFARVEQPTVGIQEAPTRPAEPFSLPVKKVLAVGHKLVEHLTKLADDLERGMQEREHKTQLIGQVASFSGMALSAGFVAWILRGGALITSFLVSMPAWRHFDPLPVLGIGEGDRRKRDREIREEAEQEKKQFRGLDRVLHTPRNESNGKRKGT